MGTIASHAVGLAENGLDVTLQGAGLRVLAVVLNSGRATDRAISISSDRLAVVRSVTQPAHADHTALATMISEGDFIWGALVYEQGEPPPSPGLVESFHVSQLDQLVARLIALREAYGEAG